MNFERWLLVARLRLRSLLLRARVEDELSQELQQHLERRTAELVAHGMVPESARFEAGRQFGNEMRVREEARDAWGWRWLDDCLQDIRFGARILLKAPGFAATAVLTLALATGATTAIFSIINSVLLRPLPFPAPDRLVQVTEMQQVGGAGAVLYQDLEAFRQQATSFEGFAGYGLTTRHLHGPAGVERLTAVIAQSHFFKVLGVQPVAGRTFGPDDRGAVAVISARLWDRLFDRDPSVVGRSLALDGNVFDAARGQSIIERRRFVVLGVMPAAFQFPYAAGSVYPSALPESQTDIWIFDDQDRRAGRLNVTARLKPDVPIETAATELTLIEKRLDETAPSPYRPTGVQLTPLGEVVLGPIAGSLWLLFGAVALVLAAACANVANLMLARTMARSGEVVTRTALGAGRLRVARQFLTESVLLSLAGGLLGVVVARWGVNLLIALGSAKIPRAHEVVLDWRVFVFLLIVCLTTAVLFGLAPAVSAARTNLQAVTKPSGVHATFGRGLGRLRDTLVVLEVALAVVLAVGAAAVLRELSRLRDVDAGMTTANVLTLHLTPRVDDSDYYRIEERVAEVPGVVAAGLSHMVPLQNWGGIGTFQLRDQPQVPSPHMPAAELRSVTPGYFQVLGIPIRSGRGLTERDSLGAPRGILINEALLRLHFAGEEPVGRETDRGTIVGVVGDVRQVGLDRPALPQIYSAVGPSAGIASDIGMSVLVRTRGSPESLIAAVRAAIREVNPNLAIFNVRTMEQVVRDSLWELNLYRWLIGLFAALALVLAAIGLYAVMSYSVTARAREFAVRLAVGSDPMGLARLVVTRGVTLAATGVVLGLVTAMIGASLVPSLPLASRSPAETFVAIAALLFVVTLAACAVPAWQVASVDPAITLRHE